MNDATTTHVSITADGRPMRQSHTVHVEARPEEVWSVLQDDERLSEWVPEIVSIEPLDDDKGVGSRFRMTMKEGGRVKTYDAEIVEYEERRTQVSRIDMGRGVMRMGFVLDGVDGGTTVTQVAEVELEGAGRLMAPLVWMMNRHFLRKQMRAFKALVEAT